MISPILGVVALVLGFQTNPANVMVDNLVAVEKVFRKCPLPLEQDASEGHWFRCRKIPPPICIMIYPQPPWCNPHPTPRPSPTVKPSVSPEPTHEPKPTPSSDPCRKQDDFRPSCADNSPKPSPRPTPSTSPEPTIYPTPAPSASEIPLPSVYPTVKPWPSFEPIPPCMHWNNCPIPYPDPPPVDVVPVEPPVFLESQPEPGLQPPPGYTV